MSEIKFLSFEHEQLLEIAKQQRAFKSSYATPNLFQEGLVETALIRLKEKPTYQPNTRLVKLKTWWSKIVSQKEIESETKPEIAPQDLESVFTPFTEEDLKIKSTLVLTVKGKEVLHKFETTPILEQVDLIEEPTVEGNKFFECLLKSGDTHKGGGIYNFLANVDNYLALDWFTIEYKDKERYVFTPTQKGWEFFIALIIKKPGDMLTQIGEHWLQLKDREQWALFSKEKSVVEQKKYMNILKRLSQSLPKATWGILLTKLPREVSNEISSQFKPKESKLLNV